MLQFTLVANHVAPYRRNIELTLKDYGHIHPSAPSLKSIIHSLTHK